MEYDEGYSGYQRDHISFQTELFTSNEIKRFFDSIYNFIKVFRERHTFKCDKLFFQAFVGSAMEEQALLYIYATNIGKDFFVNWGVADYGLNEIGAHVYELFDTHLSSGPNVFLTV